MIKEKPSKNGKIRVTIRLAKEIYRAILREAVERELSVSDLVVEALHTRAIWIEKPAPKPATAPIGATVSGQPSR